MLDVGWRLTLTGLLAAVSVGCGGDPKLYQVSGSVTYEDKPVEGATVMFIPPGGAPSMGTTDASGKYTLTTRGQTGAPPGTYTVTIAKIEGGAATETATAEVPAPAGEQPSPEEIQKFMQQQQDLASQMQAAAKEPPKNLLPAKYAVPDGSPLSEVVTEDASKNVFDFALTP
ncbi:MAG TPA: carboxypeptidase-like regulatory domain-containing protein [Pirellulales bacterium]|nr:carboxypeptidase-like regulatory domain-containing protein [Pirellulales bacterium]